MFIKCFMLLACLSTIVVPSESLSLPLPLQNLTISPANSSTPHLNLQTQRQLLQTARPPPAKKTIPIASNKVETFATKLRDDLDKQERVLHVFIGRIKQKHQQTKLKLSRVNVILKGLKAEIANATKYADQYETEATDQSKQEKLIKDEYEKSWKMFSEERENIEFEKKFLEELLKYIKLRKTQKC